MRRFALFIVTCLTAIICHAQEHLRFLDIPIAGTVEQFANKLANEKGFAIEDRNDYEDENFKMEAKILTGNFEMFNECLVVVRKIEGASETSSVIVYIDSLKCLNGEFDKLNDLYDKKYGKHSGYWGNNKWESNGGRILAGSQEGGCYVVFMDKPEVEIRDAFVEKRMKAAQDSLVNYIMDIRKEKQTVKEICGVPFGSSYEKTKEMLENKYGYPEYNPDRTVITYKHKTYAGFTFDSIHFLFQSDGIHSYLNGCVFIMDAKSLSDAKKKQEMLYKKLSDKYFMLDDTDSNGNKFYYGGYPPTPDDGVGFSIEILKYDSELARLYSPYAARLAYGRYNYVKEEF
ncbi:MAG: hypothetical protein IJ144_05330 [Prevotella sp.]|nr:hypothetical protein [Prevotella sp.]